MFTNALSFAKQNTKISFDLKDKQIETLKHLYEGKDCVSILPTGYGKSIIFQLLPWLLHKKETNTPGIVVVVCPLNALMQDQVMSLCGKGINACYLSVEGTL
jgi:superfamily II DNA helicase RecQ